MPIAPAPRPYAELGSAPPTYRFFLGDCLDVLRAMPPASVDVAVTSPPYNLGIRYSSYRDDRPREEYLAWVGEWGREIARVLQPLGSFFLNVGSMPKEPWAAMDVAQAIRPSLHLQNTLHWIKSIAIDRDAVGQGSRLDRDLVVGHYKPINSRSVRQRLPRVRVPLHAGRPHSARAPGARGALPGRLEHHALEGRGRRDAVPWQHVVPALRDDQQPATAIARTPPRFRPACLSSACASTACSRVTRVLDPFLGLGHTAVACAGLGLPCDGIEIDRAYLDEAVARVESALAPGPSQPNLL